MSERKKELRFPDNFLWGAATSAHQIEGGNVNDWSEWEKKNAERLAAKAKKKWEPWQQEKFPEMFDPENHISGRACDHYNRYEEDLDIAKSLGLNAFRISIEWSRIEPEEGKFDEREIEHYRKVIQAIRDRGMEPFVTLWHFTNPLWIEKMGGVENVKFPEKFAKYAYYSAKQLGDLVKYWMTFNEPTVIISNSYAKAEWPPQRKKLFTLDKIYHNFAKAHNLSYKKIKESSKNSLVGFSNILHYIEPNNRNSPLDNLSVKIARFYLNEKMLKLAFGKNDFLATNFYFHARLKFPKKNMNKNEVTSDLGWEIYPEGIYRVLKSLKKYDLPIYITENGLADAKDEQREKFIKDHLYWIHKAISEGTDVRGYFHWSLLDNFEWDKGFWPRFGLVEMDYKTMERKVRPSAWKYAEICRSNSLEV